MHLYRQLVELDTRLFAELDKGDNFNDEYFAEQLTARAALLEKVIHDGRLSASEANELMARSRQLKEATEQLQQQLGEQLQQMTKGRRSVRAYQTVKKN
ncbi:hypothetical protein GCM10011502_18010 [Oceanisphaera marina]|uniref:Flagellar protein FliT n=1 Tax=Oceanisphaera marina TaxID=2017550 RepID=A0ABQ1IK47_9GAMM|nr:hypothetical protein [Oceanisphaera marina]GGB45103.1 hypothetical protein GCM10011502_18010 [Oceanisphaera marina]